MNGRPWLVVTVVVCALFFALGLSDSAYDLFSPPRFEWHILVRKLESVAAFAVVGYALDRALLEARRPLRASATFGVAVYSAALEIAQRLHGSHEGLVWNSVDVACGALGGLVADAGIAAQIRDARRRARERRRAPARRP